MAYIICHRSLRTGSCYHLPHHKPNIHYLHTYSYYIQLQHAVRVQGDMPEWRLSSTPFTLIQMADSAKCLISQCYNMLLSEFHKGHPSKATLLWERDRYMDRQPMGGVRIRGGDDMLS